jgi:hypothetical protein
MYWLIIYFGITKIFFTPNNIDVLKLNYLLSVTQKLVISYVILIGYSQHYFDEMILKSVYEVPSYSFFYWLYLCL